MATPRKHIEKIRREKFNIGGEPDPKNEDLHHAINYLSAELYTKDVHFLMELIQNAEDNGYSKGVKPSLELVITSRDITATGAPATLLLFNNEKGFSRKNIESICSVGRSTKKGLRKGGYIGEKGIGFKSVFLVTSRPYIFSNGYRIRFNEEPCSHCKVGFIVPEWVDDNPTISTIKRIYGSDNPLPTTTIVLPLKPDKATTVKQQLSSIHPEVLLFLSNIKRLSVKEDNEDPRLNSVRAISILSETSVVTRKNVDVESYQLLLSAEETHEEFKKECSYRMWRQRFPVMQGNKVERRMEVEEWVLTLAFPNGQRLSRGMNSPGVYAFLPTEMVTNFPFIIQADFLLASSRETILLDNKWNQGILDCVPSAFVSAFISLVKTLEAPVSSLPSMFEFLPINNSSYPQLNVLRENIKAKLKNEDIVPCESDMEEKFFQKPSEVGRLMPAFWDIVNRARTNGVSFNNISSHGRYVLSSYFDRQEFNQILNFLGVKPVEDEWYAKCIRGSNLVLAVSEEVYLELLLFVAEKWRSKFQKTMKNMPLLKYVSLDGDVSLYSVNDVSHSQRKGKVLLSCEPHHISWLIDWNSEFKRRVGLSFVPKSTQEAIYQVCSMGRTLLKWLSDELKVDAVNVYQYATLLAYSLALTCQKQKLSASDRKLVVAYAHFLYHSLSKNYLSEHEVIDLCHSMPIVDNHGRVIMAGNKVLVPANGSKWVSLIGSNPWRQEGFVELAEDYLLPGRFAGVSTPGELLTSFLKCHLGAFDVPDISPPNAVIPSMSAPLTKENTFLLLDWIRNLRWNGMEIPSKFLACIKEGSWLKISLNGSPGYGPPSQSFLPNSSWGDSLQKQSSLFDIPIIDESFYGDQISGYKEELGYMGVMFEFGEACQFVMQHVMSMAASSTLTSGNALSILRFIKFLRKNFLVPQGHFIHTIKAGRWLRTSHGYRSPAGSVLFDQDWSSSSKISDVPFIDQDYYGEEIQYFKTELQLLDVVIGFGQNYQLVADNLKSPSCIEAPTTAKSGLFVLKCLKHLSSSDKFVGAFKEKKFLKTSNGFVAPADSFLSSPEWGCLLQVFNSFPLIDLKFYGSNSISSYKNELRKLGAVVDFEEAAKAFARTFKMLAEVSSIRKDKVLSFLECHRKLKNTAFKFPKDLKSFIREVKWLRTRLADYRAPKDCILFGPDWESISPICLLPFIDDSENHYGNDIHEYKEDLNSMGVVLSFDDGYRFVADGLKLPSNPSIITTANVYSLLEVIRNFQHQCNEPLPDSFIKQIVGQKWLKTSAGYRSPDSCLLFNSKLGSFLHRRDGPFIDEEFYGTEITFYAKELNAIGVTVEDRNWCPLLASHLDFHSNFTTIRRIYSYLRQSNWEPGNEDTIKIWIPNGSDDGEWVMPSECVLYDKDGLFGKQLHVLEKHYKKKLLPFFSSALGVKSHPLLDDYCNLWKEWESLGRVSHGECCAFWQFMVRDWSLETEKTLAECLLKLPVNSSSSDGVLLLDRHDVFICDDLRLKDLLEWSSSQSLFVWYPQPSLPNLPRLKLLEIYSKIGVQNISEIVQKEVAPVVDCNGLKQVNATEISIGKGLLRLILGFLAGPSLNMEAEKRHKVVGRLLDLTVFETSEPSRIRYGLSLSSGENLKAEARPLIRWERESKKFFTRKMDRSRGHKNAMEYATYYSEAIAQGLLWENEDHIHQLAKLIKLGFPYEFQEEAIEFLMKTENLQIFLEDERFLSSNFPPN